MAIFIIFSVIFLAYILEISVFPLFVINNIFPNLILITSFFLLLLRNFKNIFLIAFISGIFLDLISSSFGPSILSLLILFFLLYKLSLNMDILSDALKYFSASGLLILLILTFSISVVYNFLHLGFSKLLYWDLNINWYYFLYFTFFQSIYNMFIFVILLYGKKILYKK
ncbi:MAG: hypothetical protein DRP15_04130 [Candidatus Aenigmatarchaeota archaeon]|nr:MAG: hypothetical protein DRP15_04130 [Candidatus Aenigmarchaeota archaeon]